MVQITFVHRDGTRQIIEAQEGDNVMEAARHHDVEGILADCGGSMVCGTCHVFVSPEWQAKLPAQTDMETTLLEYVPEPAPNGRLTCQLKVTNDLDGIEFTLPETQR